MTLQKHTGLEGPQALKPLSRLTPVCVCLVALYLFVCCGTSEHLWSIKKVIPCSLSAPCRNQWSRATPPHHEGHAPQVPSRKLRGLQIRHHSPEQVRIRDIPRATHDQTRSHEYFPFSLFLYFSQGESKQPPEPDDQRELVHLFLADTNAARFHHHGRADRHTDLPDSHRDLYPPVCFLLLQSALGRHTQRLVRTARLTYHHLVFCLLHTTLRLLRLLRPITTCSPALQPHPTIPTPFSTPNPSIPNPEPAAFAPPPSPPYGTTHAVKL